MTQIIRVLIADDHPLILFGTDLALSRHATSTTGRHIEVVGKASNSTEVVALLQASPCDVLITDLAMPGGAYGDGLPFIAYLGRKFPDLKVIVLTMLENVGILQRLQDVGVKGVLNKNEDTGQIATAVLAVMDGRMFLGPSTREAFQEACVDERSLRATVTLSKRESEVVRLFVSGMCISEIAESLHRSVKTISTQKSNAKRKLGFKRDAELYQYAAGAGLANLPSSDSGPSDSGPSDSDPADVGPAEDGDGASQ
ncbi:MAG: response regulator [Janthinobacterium lividum]